MSRGNTFALVPVVLAGALLASMDAMALPGCDGYFATAYPDSTTENQGSCQTCHSAAPTLNYYGLDLRAQATANSVSPCSQSGFPIAAAAAEGIDSDGEGSTNLEEITANTQPGWCDTTLAGCKGDNGGATPPGVPLDPAPANTPPVADAGGPYSGEAGTTPIQFDGSGSMDPDGDSITFEWQFGDGNTATSMMPTHTYATAGNFEVRLVVDDGQARSDPSITSAAISAPPVNLAPIADPGGP